jgi:hypothetical protein
MPRGKLTEVKVVGRLTPLFVGPALMMFVLNGCGVTFRPSQEEVAKDRSTSSIRLELPPTNNSGVNGSATFRKKATGTRVELRDLPEPNEIYLAYVHPSSCEDEEHSDAAESESADHHSHEYIHEGHADAQVQEQSHNATTEGIAYPLTPVESNAAGEGSIEETPNQSRWRAFHWHPVQSTYQMALMTARSEALGLPSLVLSTSTSKSTRPACRVDQEARLKTRWERQNRRSSPSPTALRAEATVLLPGASIAPAKSTWTCWKTLIENSGANGASTCIIVVGKVRISFTAFSGDW